MAFSWTVDKIDDNIKIDMDIMNELKTNLDTLNSGCYTHRATNYVVYYVGYDTTINSANNGTRQTLTGGSCFIAGTKVLLADGSWKKIEDFEGGEQIVGLTGINNVIRLETTYLDYDRALYTLEDEDIYFTGEHKFWIKTSEGKEYPGIVNYNEFQYDRYIPDGLDFLSNEPYFIARRERLLFATIDGWKESMYRFNEKGFSMCKPDLPLYALVADGSHSMIANGYVVSAWMSDFDFDYSIAKWNPEEVLKGINIQPL